MIGAIIGDIAGSRFEFNNYRAKDFEIFSSESYFTDDTVMTLAVGAALLNCQGDYENLNQITEDMMHQIGRAYPNSGYGGNFFNWMFSDNFGPYNSFGNGAAMRVSPVAWAAKDLEECKTLSKKVTEITHNHPEGIKGAEATAVATFMALHGSSKDEIRAEMEGYYDLGFTIDEIRSTYQFNETCQQTVPQAIVAFLESNSFEDAILTAVSVGGDSDTLAAITGGIAEAFYGVPKLMHYHAKIYLDDSLRSILDVIETKYPPKLTK